VITARINTVSKPTISIVTPSYNQAEFLRWTMRSVLLQRYDNLEYIVMDGGSSDGSADDIASVADRLAHWQSAPDDGQAHAVAEGFKHATGDICAWLNSDDLLAPGALHAVAEFFESHPDVDMVYSNRVFVDDSNEVTAYWVLPPHSSRFMRRWDLIPQETAFWRRSAMERAGGVDPTFRFALDYDFFVRMMRCSRLVRLPRFLGAFRVHDLSKTVRDLETVGAAEIQRVQSAYEIRYGRRARLAGPAFTGGVQLASNLFIRSGRSMPGSLPGIGWNYDTDLWGGLLGEEELPVLASAAQVS
jgi:glycosyltransferase involved in cell wall biosynthesis